MDKDSPHRISFKLKNIQWNCNRCILIVQWHHHLGPKIKRKKTMQVCKGLCLLYVLSSPLKRRLRRKTGGNSSVPCRNGRASSPRHLSECKHLAAPSGSTERNVHLLLYLGLMRTQLILCLDPGDTLAVPLTRRSGLPSPGWRLSTEFRGWLFSSLQKIMVNR